MAPTMPNPSSALRSIDIPRTPNAAMLSAAKRTLAETGPRVLQSAAHAMLLKRASLTLQSDAQKITIGVFCGYLVAIAVIWHIPVVHKVLWPFKMLAVAFHEFGHAFACLCTGGRVKSMSLIRQEGGETQMYGGWTSITLPAGYLGSSLMGALLIFCGFNIVASKVASFVLGVTSLLTIIWGWRNKYIWLVTLLNVGLLVACWFIADSEALRYYVLFIGTMSASYSIWDIVDDTITRQVAESDACRMAEHLHMSMKGGRVIGIIWLVVSVCLMVASILCGILAFPESTAEQREDSENFVDASR